MEKARLLAPTKTYKGEMGFPAAFSGGNMEASSLRGPGPQREGEIPRNPP
jgi:hypothetical protein